MIIGAAFPSEYLKAADLQGRQITVKMDRVEMREVGDGPKPVLFFDGKDKGMVLNKTNANAISAAYGDDTDDWTGSEVVLFQSMVDFQGKTVAAIRVKVPPRKPGKQTVTSGRPTPPPAEPDDDDVPF